MSRRRNAHGIRLLPASHPSEVRSAEEIESADWQRIAEKTKTIAKPEPAPEPPSRNVLDTQAPPCPPYLRPEEYEALRELREKLA